MNTRYTKIKETEFESFSATKTIVIVLCAALSITVPYIIFSLIDILPKFPNIVRFSIAALIGGLGFQVGYILLHNKKCYGDYRISKSLGCKIS